MIRAVAVLGVVVLFVSAPHGIGLTIPVVVLAACIRVPLLGCLGIAVAALFSWASGASDPLGVFADHSAVVHASVARAAELVERCALLALLVTVCLAPIRRIQPASKPRARVLSALMLLAIVLAASYASRERCLIPGIDRPHVAWSCYSELTALYEKRGFSEGYPVYLEGTGELRKENPTGDFDYPPGTGAVAAVALATSEGERGFLRANSVQIGIFSVAALALLAGLVRDHRRLLLFVVAPTMFFHAFTNWDLVAVALMVGGLVAATREREILGGALLGLGAATKLFPGVLLPVVAIAYVVRTRRFPFGVIAAGVGSFLALNLPIALLNPPSYWAIWEFHVGRDPSIWSMFAALTRRIGAGPLGTASATVGLATVLVVMVLACVLEVRRCEQGERFRVWSVSFCVLATWLLVSKIFSPQALLWLLPFFVIVKMPGWTWLLFAQVSVYFTVATIGYEIFDETATAAHWLAIGDGAVAVRSVTLVLLAVFALRSTESIREASGRWPTALAWRPSNPFSRGRAEVSA